MTLKRTEFPLVADLVQRLHVAGCPPLFCLRDDLPLLEAVLSTGAPAPEKSSPPLLLAPLDPLIYDRRLTSALWSFNYTWEVYTPPTKRLRGYYALPVLHGLDLVGHVDPKADRATGRLRVISRSVRRGVLVAGAVRQLAGFLRLK